MCEVKVDSSAKKILMLTNSSTSTRADPLVSLLEHQHDDISAERPDTHTYESTTMDSLLPYDKAISCIRL